MEKGHSTASEGVGPARKGNQWVQEWTAKKIL